MGFVSGGDNVPEVVVIRSRGGRNTFGTWLRYVRNVVAIRSERGRDTFRTWLRYVRNVVVIRSERGCDTFGTWLNTPRNVVAIRSERGCDTFRTWLNTPRNDIKYPSGRDSCPFVLSSILTRFSAICFNSETAQIPENIVESLRLRFRHITLLYDTDETSKRESERQAEQLAGYTMCSIPRFPFKVAKAKKTSPTTSN